MISCERTLIGDGFYEPTYLAVPTSESTAIRSKAGIEEGRWAGR